MSRLYYLDEDDIHSIVETLTRDLFPGTPAFQLAGERGQGLLESALAQPRWPHHRTAQQKAAALHYSLNKNHPYVDGNKRLAVTATEWFLYRNDFVLFASNDQLMDFALRVADDRLSRTESTRWLNARAVRRTWSDARHARWLESLTPQEDAEVTTAVITEDALAFMDAADRRTVSLREEVAAYFAG
ncbi:MAG: type II toxin-antitoxin system death-on-curing family toxin [Dehalococcoidia bacterium]